MQAMAIRIAIMTAVILIAAVCFLATGAFLCVALYDGLKLVLSPPLAALATAGIFLVLALIIIAIGSAIARAAERKAKREREKKRPATAQLGLEIGRILGEQVARYAGKNPTQVLIGAVIAGFALGAIPSLRSFLMSFIKRK
jgi:membrane protein implicated in regulation of membrane protease activity